MQYRHEVKQRINNLEMIIINDRIKNIMHLDEHTINGEYEITSLYFDTQEDKSLKENLNGISKRSKYRIRYYNDNLNDIFLEKKCKESSLGYKLQTRINKEDVLKIINGNVEEISTKDNLLIELLYKIKYETLKPKTIVKYKRIPYIYEAGNVRVTFDYDIRTSININEFLKDKQLYIPIKDNTYIMEVKWDNYLPDIIKDLILIKGLNNSAFSKYVASRMYE